MARPSNGYETLVSAIERLAEEHDNIRLVLLGSGHKLKSYSESSVVITPGFVGIDEFVKWFQQASIYIQPSIGDSFPVATLEGILSGTPTIVTQAVGVRELLPEEQVVDPTITGLYQGAKHFYQMDLNKRYEIGNEQRDLVSDFTEANQKRRFRESINNLT
jgi:glycosyltransferase involved in cell wall biosynthesis